MIKPFLTYDLQLDKLSNEKHLLIPDRKRAEEALKSIGYFSLISGYKTPFIDPMTRVYLRGTTFDDIYFLYLFDQSLRELIFKYLCKVELTMKQLISYSFCKKHGESQSEYLNPANYNNIPPNSLKLKKLLNILAYQANVNTEHLYIVHQRSVYHNVPLWVLINTLTYGQTSHFYSLLPFSIKSDISKEFSGITEKELEKYLKILTIFRNICAHNERLYSFRLQIDFPDTILHAKLRIPKQGNQYRQGKKDLFGLIIALRYLLPRKDYLSFKSQISKLIKNYKQQSTRISECTLLRVMGFPPNWMNITRYKL